MTEVSVARLTRRLADTPPDFLADPAAVAVPAVVSDLLLMAGGTTLDAADADLYDAEDPKQRRLLLILTWLLADPELLACGPDALSDWLTSPDLVMLAQLVDTQRFVQDPDRREELARLTLRALRLGSAGESPDQAADRLSTVDSVRRQEVLVAARAAEERAAAVRKAMEEQRAQEAAARYSQV